MKILNVTAQKPSSTGSGIYLSELVRYGLNSGHSQAIVAGCVQEDTLNFPDCVNLYPVYYSSSAMPFPVLGMSDEMPYPSTKYIDMTDEMFQQFSSSFRDVLTRAVETEDPDVIVCHHLYLLTALVRQWFPHIPIVGISHGSDLRQLEKNPFMRETIISAIGKLDHIIALQNAQKEEIQRIFSCAGQKITAAGAGYNHHYFYPGEKRCASHPRRLVFAGKVTEKKGVISLMRALSLMQYPVDDLQVFLAGGHAGREEYDHIRRLAALSPYPVSFLGPLPQEELGELFRSCDVFVLPSFFEGLPLVTIEAMACGCRVVCSDLPGLRQWYAQNVPGEEAAFVPLPERGNVDEPLPGELPGFERRLADAITAKLNQSHAEHPDLRGVSWDGVGQRIYAILMELSGRR